MDDILAGVKPVNQQNPVTPKAQQPAAPAGVVDPLNPASMEVPVQPTAQPEQVVTPAQEPAPQAPVAPVVEPVIEPVIEPVAEVAPVVGNLFSDDWTFDPTLFGDTPLDRRLGKLFEASGVDGKELFQGVAHNQLDAEDIKALETAFGDDYEFMMDSIDHIVKRDAEAEATRLRDVVGGENAFGGLMAWTKAQRAAGNISAVAFNSIQSALNIVPLFAHHI